MRVPENKYPSSRCFDNNNNFGHALKFSPNTKTVGNRRFKSIYRTRKHKQNNNRSTSTTFARKQMIIDGTGWSFVFKKRICLRKRVADINLRDFTVRTSIRGSEWNVISVNRVAVSDRSEISSLFQLAGRSNRQNLYTRTRTVGRMNEGSTYSCTFV